MIAEIEPELIVRMIQVAVLALIVWVGVLENRS